jgi:DNA polymerase I-like protein with 3'-5' exonuclease and polymerase domains
MESADNRVAIDTETPGLRWRHGDSPWMISMADSNHHSWCALWPIDPYTRRVMYNDRELRTYLDPKVYDYTRERYEYLKEICADPKKIKVFFNAPFDIGNLGNMGIEVAGKIEEVSLQARAYKTNELAYKLKYLSRRYQGLTSEDEKDLKKTTVKLRKIAKQLGWKIFEEEGGAKSDEGKAPPDYWLTMFAHLLLDDADEVTLAREQAEEYCRKDTLRTIVMFHYYLREFQKDPVRAKTYDFEMEIFPILREMENLGCSTVKQRVLMDRQSCVDKAEETLREIREIIGKEDFTPSQTKTYSSFLFSEPPIGLGLPPTELTKTGQYTTGIDELVRVGAANHPFVRLCTSHAAQEKAVSLFFDKYLQNMLPDPQFEGRHVIHPSINQGNTKTFRLSMSDPNLQQAANPDSSKHGANVVQVRSSFFPRPGYYWVLFDYSGQELRLLGGVMGVKLIHEAVRDGIDVPTKISNQIWGGQGNDLGIAQAINALELHSDRPSTQFVANAWTMIGWHSGLSKDRKGMVEVCDALLSQFDYDYVKFEAKLEKKVSRTLVKNTIYAELYGAGVDKIAWQNGTTIERASEIKRLINNQMPEKVAGSRRLIEQAKANGYIVSIYGDKIDVDPEFAYRAVNYSIQNPAAKMMKISMRNCRDFIRRSGIDARIILTVHDELIFEVRAEHCTKQFCKGIKVIMEDHQKYTKIPMSVGISLCRERWDLEEKVKL